MSVGEGDSKERPNVKEVDINMAWLIGGRGQRSIQQSVIKELQRVQQDLNKLKADINNYQVNNPGTTDLQNALQSNVTQNAMEIAKTSFQDIMAIMRDISQK